MKKIVHISTADTGGAGLCAYRICKAQRDLGMDAHLIVMHRTHTDNFVHQVGAVAYFLQSARRKVKKLLGMPDEINTCRELGRQRQATYTLPISPIDLTHNPLIASADVIHLHWIGGLIDYPSFFKAYSHKPIVFTLHDESMLHGIASVKDQCLRDHPLEQKYYRLKLSYTRDIERLGVVFLSKAIYDEYHDHEMLARAHKTIIHNLVDCSLFKPYDRAYARRALTLPDTKLFGFCAYAIGDPRKGLGQLSEALTRMNPQYRILAIGKNRGKKSWPNVMEMGFHTDPGKISQILSAADFFCLPSLKEDFAQAPLEALACGTPVIMSPCSGSDELITPENGVRYADFSTEALIEGIGQAMQKSYDRTALRQDVTRRFSPQKIARDYLRFYDTLTS